MWNIFINLYVYIERETRDRETRNTRKARRLGDLKKKKKILKKKFKIK